jgi:hypothetical protein
MHFVSRIDVVKRLERYLKALEAVTQTVRECLAELRGSA